MSSPESKLLLIEVGILWHSRFSDIGFVLFWFDLTCLYRLYSNIFHLIPLKLITKTLRITFILAFQRDKISEKFNSKLNKSNQNKIKSNFRKPQMYYYLTEDITSNLAVADLRGAWGTRPSPWGPKFFQFHAVFGKIWQNRMLAPPWGVGAPSSGKSWIRHCLGLRNDWIPSFN